jgi:hypothetical protein
MKALASTQLRLPPQVCLDVRRHTPRNETNMLPTAKTTKTEFYGKTWLYRIGAFLSALLAFICVLIAILFLSGISQPANGIPGGVAGIRSLFVAAPIFLFGFLLWFHVLARRRPLLRICHEGLEVNVVGRGSLDHVPGIPTSIKLAWLVLSMQGFRKQIGWIPWESYRGVSVSGLPAFRKLTIHGTVAFPRFRGDKIEATVVDHILFHGSEYRDSLEDIAKAIETTFHHPETWSSLPSLHDS